MENKKTSVFAVILLLLALAALAAGCGGRTADPARGTPEEGVFQIYYLDASGTVLTPNEYRTETRDTDLLIAELMDQLRTVPNDLDSQSAIPERVEYRDFRREEMVVYLLFSDSYNAVLMTVYILPLFFALDADYPQPEAGSKRKGILPNAAVTAFLAVLIALEVYFSYFQVRYLFLNLGTLPEGVSYAEYARGGFFEIAAATLLTVALIFAATVLTRRDEDEELPLSVRLLLTVFSACVVLMFASSYYRMLMYMDAYSMTIRRVGVCWLMALMLAVLIGVIIYIWKPDFALTRYTIFTVLVFVLALNLMHLGATVSKNNVDRYFQEQEAEVKTGYQLDEDYLYTLLPASAPDLARLLETPDYASYDLRVRLNEISEQEQSWRAWNYDWYRAQKACDAVEKPKSLWVVLQVSTQLQAPVSALNFEMKQGNKTLAAGRLNKSDGSVFLPGDRIEINYADFSPISSKQDLTLYSFRFEAVLENNTYVAADAMVSDPYTEDGRLRLTLIPNDANDFFTVRVG